MTVGHSKDSISRIAAVHGVISTVRDFLYEDEVDDRLPLEEACDRLDEKVVFVEEGIENQQEGNDPWLVGEPWVKIIEETDIEQNTVKYIELTENGRETANVDRVDVDPAYQTGVGHRGRSD